MVRIASRKSSVRQVGVMSKTGVVAPTTIGGIALGSGPSIGTTSTSNNVAVVSTTGSSDYVRTNTGSVNQISGLASPSGIHTIASVNILSDESAGSSSSGAASSSTNYKLSIASMLLAMKNQALGSLSLGGSKTGGSITENYSGVNLG